MQLLDDIFKQWSLAGNKTIRLLTPDELEQFAELEQRGEDIRTEMEKLLTNVEARKPLTDWQEAPDPETEAILRLFPDSIHPVLRLMDPDEMFHWAELFGQFGEVSGDQARFLREAAQKRKTL